MKIGSFFDDKPGGVFHRAVPQPKETEALLGPKAGDPLPVPARAKVEMFAAEIKDICARATVQPLTNLTEAHQLTELLSRSSAAKKELEATLKAILDPLNKQVKAIRASFSPLTDALDNVTERGKRVLLAWNQQERARRVREEVAAQKAIAEAAAKEGEATALAESAETPEERRTALDAAEAASREQSALAVAAPMPAPRVLRGDTGSAGVRKRWTFEVVKAEEVPRPFLIVDEKAIRAAVLAGAREIPGVNIYESEEIAVRVGS